MIHQDQNHGASLSAAALGAIAAALLYLAIFAAAPAAAAYEQVGIFAGSEGPPAEPGKFPEEVQLGGVGGMAVNSSGVGGVAPGTVYAASSIGGGAWVAMYAPEGEGLRFVGAWQVTALKEEYERCGPPPLPTLCQARVKGLPGKVDVDVDQTTGNVYVLNAENQILGTPLVAEYTPDGSAEITRFGIRSVPGKTTAETPAEIHESPFPGGLAVGEAGSVYVFDENNSDNHYHRLMVFRPQSPGDYANYVYAGTGADVAAGFIGDGNNPTMPVADAAGHIYVAGAGETYIEEYDPTQPGSGPICEFEFAKGGITAITVNPVSGAVFFFSSRPPKRIHQLSPCAGGKFSEVGEIALAPERDDLYGLAFDPAREIGTRPAGVLYGGAPGPIPSGGVGPGQPGRSSLGYIFAPSEENPPTVGAGSVSNVTATTARLSAQINPNGFQTRYAFQYITDAAYQANPEGERFNGAQEAPLEGGLLGGGNAAIAAALTLTGLAPETEYHYRAIATSNCAPGEPTKVCPATGPEQSFRTFALSGPVLADGRAYELVSPTQKYSGQVLPADSSAGSGTCGRTECNPGNGYTRFPLQSTPDGGAIVYEGTPFSPAGGAAIENEYIARRIEGTGWPTINLTPPLLTGKGGGYKAFDPGLSRGVLQQLTPTLSPEAPAGYPNLYLQSTADPLGLGALLTQPPPNRLPGTAFESLKLTYGGASADLSRVFFAANDALTQTTPFAPEAIGGAAGETNLYEWAAGQLRLVNVAPGNASTLPGAAFSGGQYAVSTDGSRVFWSSKAGQAYVRINGEVTQEIKDPGKLLTASADGSKALLDDGCLYDLAAEACEDLSADQAGVHKGGFLGIVGRSEDLSRVYFLDTAALTTGAEAGTCKEAAKDTPERGEENEGKVPPGFGCNLYSWQEGATTLIAALLAKDLAPANGEASPNGRWLSFISRAQLSGYDNLGPCEHTGGGATLIIPCTEAFLYDSATGQLRCPSCNPSAASPLGTTTLRQIEGGSLRQPRYLTDSGRLYFDSQDSLVPADTNGGAEDVYQFEPAGLGDCQLQGGCVSLISAGREAGDSNFLAMDAAADNVFFTTRDRLLPADKDELIDLYDARVGGGFAAESQAPPSECKGEACQPSPPVPAELSPSSSSGSGKAKAPKKCKKGQVKRHGKCVKKPQHKGKKHKSRAHRQERGGRG